MVRMALPSLAVKSALQRLSSAQSSGPAGRWDAERATRIASSCAEIVGKASTKRRTNLEGGVFEFRANGFLMEV